MSTPPESNWFLEVNGKTTGPWTLAQLKELFEQGHIQAQQRVTNAAQRDLTLTVEEAVASLHSGGSVHLPPRPPSELTGPIAVDRSLFQREDPTLDLFDVIQSTRDRATVAKPPVQAPRNLSQQADSPFGRNAMIAAGALAVVGATVWALSQAEKVAPAPQARVAETVAPPPAFKLPPAAPTPTRSVSTITVGKPPVNTTVKLNPPKFNFSATQQALKQKKDQEEARDREREKEREREREKEEREREKEERDRYRDRRDWRARDDRGDPIGATDRDPLAPGGTEAGSALAPAPAPAAPPRGDRPGGSDRTSDRYDDRHSDRYDDAQNPKR